jgi:outer membrane protein OmpA-like peptidoglycan-associated protein
MRYIILVVLAFLPTILTAQVKPVISDDFTSNQNLWDVSSSKTISDGVYTITTTSDGDESLISRFIDPQKDFKLMAEFTSVAGDCSYGLTWNNSDTDYNLFLISPSKEFVVYSGDPSQVKGWKKTDAVKAAQMNMLRIEKTTDKISFFINNIKVEERKPTVQFGNWLGILIFDQGNVKIDNYSLLQEQQINIPVQTNHIVREDLGNAVNTSDDELGPIISSDGRTIFFDRQNVATNTGGVNDDEDVYSSRFEADQWSIAKNMGNMVNTPLADNLVAVSADNNTLMFAKSNELFVKHRTENGWSDFEKINITISNQSQFFVASLSADNKAIVFSAKLHENLFHDNKRDECDLYVSTKDKSNKWSAPVNLGKVINTPGNETSPYLSADTKTLYFATDGRPGLGYQDIFYSKRLDDTWTSWSVPVNLGPEVNTPGFDAYYTVPASGDNAYFVSQGRGGKGDIFRIRLHDEAKPNPVTVVSGLVLSSKTKLPLSARIHFENLTSGVEVGEARSDPKTGAYRIVLPFGTLYGIRAYLTDYYSVHENIELKESDNKYTEVKKDLFMVPLQIGETIKLNNVFFEAGLPTLKSESFPELNRLMEILKDNPGIYIELAGHTDNKGDASTLLKLSEDRVSTVKAYLVSNGIDTNRITGKGYGATQPVASSDTEENSKANRRVEFKITQK